MFVEKDIAVISVTLSFAVPSLKSVVDDLCPVSWPWEFDGCKSNCPP